MLVSGRTSFIRIQLPAVSDLQGFALCTLGGRDGACLRLDPSTGVLRHISYMQACRKTDIASVSFLVVVDADLRGRSCDADDIEHTYVDREDADITDHGIRVDACRVAKTVAEAFGAAIDGGQFSIAEFEL